MKRFLTYICVVIIALGFASCEPGKPFNSYGFEGEYEMRTEIYSYNPDNEFVRAPRAIISPVLMFVENDHLYIRTNGFGMPNLGEYDEQEIEGTTDPPMDTPENYNYDDGNGEGDEVEGEGIETIEATQKSYIIIKNGMVYVIKDNKHLKSLPIQAFYVLENQIIFANSDSFDVAIINEEGENFGTWRLHYEYGPVVLKDETITWDIELCVDPGTVVSNGETEHNYNITYRNTLVRK